MAVQRAGHRPLPYHHCQQQGQWAGRMDDQDAQGLYPAWPDQDAHNLLDEPFSLGSTLVRMTASRMTGIAPYLLATSRQPLLPSIAIPGLPSLPGQLTLDEEETYLAKVSRIVQQLQRLGGAHIKETEQRIQQLTRWDEGAKVNPMALFYF